VTGMGIGTTSISFEPMSPVAFLDRSAVVYRDRTAVVDGDRRWSYGEFHQRCLRQAGLLVDVGITEGDRVAVLAPNSSLLLAAHFGVVHAGGVLVALNTRLSPSELAAIVEHAGARVLLFHPDTKFDAEQIRDRVTTPLILIGGDEYESMIEAATPTARTVTDERGLLALNYTSGTTGSPKGVMYHHRGAYLQSLAMVTHFQLTNATRYLWTLPMFHCNGWCFTWAVTAAGGTHICVPRIDPAAVWALIRDERVTHLCAAPTVLISLLADEAAASGTSQRVVAAVGGAPPTPRLLQDCAEAGFDITHLYGLTETFGPLAICDWQPAWDSLPVAEQARRRARQGVGNVIACTIRVVAEDGTDVPADGRTLGEIAVRGNNVMLGYFHDPAATAAVVPDGWLRTGDLAVRHPDGYLEIRDRKKDLIISGGENISSVEVEAALAAHPDVLEAAVVAVPDARWGERPVAWVTPRGARAPSAAELRAFVRERLAGFKVPDRFYFGPLPKTSTGKIQKYVLRERSGDTTA
jgi:fatty-acyl-CoA synthase